jgi:hypothetical protein
MEETKVENEKLNQDIRVHVRAAASSEGIGKGSWSKAKRM